MVEPPRSKRASKGRSSAKAEPPWATTPSGELEEIKPSTISEPNTSRSKRERKKALKTKAKEKKSPKGSVRRGLEQKEEKPVKRTIPFPPTPPKRRKRIQSKMLEGAKEPSPE